MKIKSHILITLSLGLLIGWTLGFLRLPYIETNASFGLGFMAGLSVFALVLLLLAVWNKEVGGFGFRISDFGSLVPHKEATETNSGKNTRTQTVLGTVLIGFPILGGLMSGAILYRQNIGFRAALQRQDAQLREMTALTQAANNHNFAPVTRNLLDGITQALKHNPQRTLPDTLIAQIVALSTAFKPYHYFDRDSLSAKAYSPERGQLLQALAVLKLAPATFDAIKRRAVFAGADLRQANLKGLNLDGINLNAANLRDADLSDAKLGNADLGEANLWGANLTGAKLNNTNMKRADLTWAKLNNATLTKTNLNGAILANTQLIKAVITEATLQWALASGALFNEAHLAWVNCTGTDFTKANFKGANLRYSDLKKANLRESNLLDAQFNAVFVDTDWSKQLAQWQPLGLQALQENYAVVNDTADKGGRPMYRLKQKED